MAPKARGTFAELFHSLRKHLGSDCLQRLQVPSLSIQGIIYMEGELTARDDEYLDIDREAKDSPHISIPFVYVHELCTYL